MLIPSKVNDKVIINKPKYFHCFKLNDSSYALFDIKMDMPIIIGSLSIIKSVKLPINSIVFYYKLGSGHSFIKPPEKTIEINGTNFRRKPPLRYHRIDINDMVYHHFKLSSVLSVLFNDDFSMPIAYGSNQRIQSTINSISKQASIFYYKEDFSLKNSFKFFNIFDGKTQSKP